MLTRRLLAAAVLSVGAGTAQTFVAKCAGVSFPAGHAFDDFEYVLGVVDDQYPAVEFTAVVNAPAWVGVGFRAQNITGMTDLDTVALDTEMEAVFDFDTMVATSGPPTQSATTTSFVSSYTNVGGNAKEMKFVRRFENDGGFTLAVGKTVSVATATGAGKVGDATWTRHTKTGEDAVVFSTCAALEPYLPTIAPLFGGVCPPVSVAGSAFPDFSYTLGVVENSKAAVEFRIQLPAVMDTWGAVGVRPQHSVYDGMKGLDITAVNSATQEVHDFELQTATSGAPTKSGTTLSGLTSHSSLANFKIIQFYRLLNNGVDMTLEDTVAFNLATAMGDGTAPDAWMKHTATPNQQDVTFTACALMQAYLTPSGPADAFQSKCGYTDFPEPHVFTSFGYRLGLMGGDPAIEFTVRVPVGGGGDVWAAVGMRDTPGANMVGLYITAFDNAVPVVRDFEPATRVGAPVAAATSTSVFGSRSTIQFDTIIEFKYHRKFDAGAGFVLKNKQLVNFATAVGDGKVADTWTQHAQRRASSHALEACDELLPFITSAAGAFEGVCPETAITEGHVFESLAYTFGTASGEPAIAFKIKLPWNAQKVWGAVGVREEATGYSMAGLDIFAADSSDAVVYDFEKTTGTGAPQASLVTRTQMTSLINLGAAGYEMTLYRLLDNGYDVPIALQKPFNLATATGFGQVMNGWAKHTARTATDVTLAACDEMEQVVTGFTPLCPFTAFPGTHAFAAFGYRLGITRRNNAVGVEFLVRFEQPGAEEAWAAVGVRGTAATGAGMTGLDIMAVDSTAAVVHDFEVMTAASGPPVKSTADRSGATLSKATKSGTTWEVKFYREFTAANDADVGIANGVEARIATAIGEGVAAGSWTQHSANEEASHTFEACGDLVPYLTALSMDEGFEAHCDPVTVDPANHAFESFSYTMGIADGMPAVEFTVRLARPAVATAKVWGAVGVRALPEAGAMVGLDVLAVDTASMAVARFEATTMSGAPVRNGVAQSLSGSADVNGAREMKFYRKWNEGGGGTVIEEGVEFNLATAQGPGSPHGAADWTVHTSRGEAAVTLNACPALRAALPGAFVAKCPAITVPTTAHAFELLNYTLGVVGTAPAVAFTVQFKASDDGGAAADAYAIVGLRPAGAADGLVDYFAVTSAAQAVADYDAAGGTVTAAASTVSEVGAYATTDDGASKVVTVYRLFDNGQDAAIVAAEVLYLTSATGMGRDLTPSEDAASPWKDSSLQAAPHQLTLSDGACPAMDAFLPTVPQSAFTAVCPQQDYPGTHAFSSFKYTLGTAAGGPAVQYTAAFPVPTDGATPGYAAVGVRDVSAKFAGRMQGVDAVGVDTSGASGKVTDLVIAAGPGAPGVAGATHSVLTSMSTSGGEAVATFHRLLQTPDASDMLLTDGRAVNFATAVGTGAVGTSWTQHTTSVSSDHAFSACDTLRVTLPKYLCFEVASDVSCPGALAGQTCDTSAAWQDEITQGVRSDLALTNSVAVGVGGKCVQLPNRCTSGCTVAVVLPTDAPLATHDALQSCTFDPSGCPSLAGAGLVATDTEEKDDGTEIWVVIVIIVSVLVVLGLCGGLAAVWWKQRQKKATVAGNINQLGGAYESPAGQASPVETVPTGPYYRMEDGALAGTSPPAHAQATPPKDFSPTVAYSADVTPPPQQQQQQPSLAHPLHGYGTPDYTYEPQTAQNPAYTPSMAHGYDPITGASAPQYGSPSPPTLRDMLAQPQAVASVSSRAGTLSTPQATPATMYSQGSPFTPHDPLRQPYYPPQESPALTNAPRVYSRPPIQSRMTL